MFNGTFGAAIHLHVLVVVDFLREGTTQCTKFLCAAMSIVSLITLLTGLKDTHIPSMVFITASLKTSSCCSSTDVLLISDMHGIPAASTTAAGDPIVVTGRAYGTPAEVAAPEA